MDIKGKRIATKNPNMVMGQRSDVPELCFGITPGQFGKLEFPSGRLIRVFKFPAGHSGFKTRVSGALDIGHNSLLTLILVVMLASAKLD